MVPGGGWSISTAGGFPSAHRVRRDWRDGAGRGWFLQHSHPHTHPRSHSLSTAVGGPPFSKGTESAYELAEVRLGGGLTRHDLSIAQLGPRTSTGLASFLLASGAQLHDLHSRLILDHPHGQADQLHKCGWGVGRSAAWAGDPGVPGSAVRGRRGASRSLPAHPRPPGASWRTGVPGGCLTATCA